MEAIIAATFFIAITVNGVPVRQLQAEMPLADCLDEARRFLLRHHEYQNGAVAQAGCAIKIAPQINH